MFEFRFLRKPETTAPQYRELLQQLGINSQQDRETFSRLMELYLPQTPPLERFAQVLVEQSKFRDQYSVKSPEDTMKTSTTTERTFSSKSFSPLNREETFFISRKYLTDQPFYSVYREAPDASLSPGSLQILTVRHTFPERRRGRKPSKELTVVMEKRVDGWVVADISPDEVEKRQALFHTATFIAPFITPPAYQ